VRCGGCDPVATRGTVRRVVPVPRVEQHEVHEELPSGPVEEGREVHEGVDGVEAYVVGAVARAELFVTVAFGSAFGFSGDEVSVAQCAGEDAEYVG